MMAETEADVLRANLARYLAPTYLDAPATVAILCDEQIDKSGRLLGMVRTEARALFARRADGQSSP